MTRRLMTRLTFVVSLCVLGTLGAVRAFAPPPQARPAAEPFSVEFLAVASDGRPIRDLKPEDLTVKMDGKTRSVKSIQLVPIADAPGSGVKLGSVDTPAPFDTNVVSHTGRNIMFVVDDESMRTGEERRLKEAATQLLAELPPTDRIAIATVPHGGIKIDFTTDFEKVRKTIDQLAGQGPQVALVGQQAACQSRSVLDQLVGTINAVGNTGSPTTFIFLTSGLVGPRSDAIRPQQTVGVCELTADHFQNVAVAAAEAHMQFYMVQAEWVMIATQQNANTALFGGNDNPLVGLEHLAGVTGGKVLHLTLSGENMLTRIMRETSAYYQITFDVDPQDRNSNTHKLEIKTTRADAVVHALPMLVNGKAATGKSGAKPAAPKTARDTLKDANAYRDLTLRSTAFFSRNPGDKMMVVDTFEALDPAVKVTQAVAGLYDKTGKLVAEWVSKPEDLAGSPMKAGMLVVPGTYRLRSAIGDAAGHLGVVDSTIIAELAPAGSLKLSSLVLGAPNAAGAFTPKLEFTSTDAVAIVFFELYGGKTNMQLGANVELAASVNGPALASAQPQWGGTAEADRFTGTAQLPIASLAPGDYVVRAIVGVQGEPEGRVVRTLRKR